MKQTSVTHGVEKYLSKLHTYLLALAIAGSTSVEGAPQEEIFGSDSTKLIKVPCDVLQSYYFRAARAAMTVPEASRLAWLESRDISERSVWVSQFREGNEPLGQVVQSIMEKRGAGAPTGTHRFITWSSRMQPINLGSSSISSTRGQQTIAQHQPMKQQHRPGDSRRGSSNSHLVAHQNQKRAQPQMHYGMERHSAQISTTTSATGKAHHARKAYTSAPKSSAAADLVA